MRKYKRDCTCVNSAGTSTWSCGANGLISRWASADGHCILALQAMSLQNTRVSSGNERQ